MTMQQHEIDRRVIIDREKAMAVRNAYLALLRAFEDLYDLPRSIPSKQERGDAPPRTGTHHNR